MKKNIVILSDGTGQDGGAGHNTNVYKLFNMLLQRSKYQVVFYDQGVGTEGSGGVSKLKRALSKGTGWGISKNILDCYRFLFDHYKAGDRVYVLGFSRGATTVRSLSSFIDLFGILPQSRPELIDQAWAIYKKKDREERAKEFINRHHTMWCKIEFLGAWDTVAALGIPIKWLDKVVNAIPIFRHKFQDLSLSPSVINAYHALAIDDERRTFHPVLWDPDVSEGQKVEQVWFAGMHTDVGGGYEQQTLSDVPLRWMIDKAKDHGLLIYERHKVMIEPDPDGFMHNSRGKFWEKLYRKKTRSWPHETHGEPNVHISVTQRTKAKDNNPDSPYDPWILKSNFNVVS